MSRRDATLTLAVILTCAPFAVSAGLLGTAGKTRWYQLEAAHSGRCLDVAGGPGGIADGQNVQQWTCGGDAATNQHWRPEWVTDTHRHIIARHSGKCLDVEGGVGAIEDGANIDQWRCGDAGDSNQLWRLERVRGLNFQLRAAHSNKCLGVAGASSAEGANVEQQTCGGRTAEHQLWRPRIAARGDDDGDNIRYTTDQGFDACSAPSATVMQGWAQSSPYRYLGIYIGGSLRACSQPNLTASWIDTTSAQGWGYLPTWVGPQAPCSGFRERISYDPATAYQEGRDEAQAAAQVANSLGLERSIIYYDMEFYDETAACVAATRAFVSGWSDELATRDFTAGVYSSPCNLDDYRLAATPPDAIWGAHWIYSGYTPSASPYGMVCLDDSAWNGERIRQYAGDHDEQWGSYRLNIDSNTADGPIAISDQAPRVRDLGVADGWWLLLDDGRLMASANDGLEWRDLTPAGAALDAMDLADDGAVWAVDLTASGVLVYQSADGGANWRSIAADIGPLADMPVGRAYLEASGTRLDLTLELTTGVNFSRGWLLRSDDLGGSWTRSELPLGGPVHFVDAEQGWIAGGPTGDALYATSDGGRSWQRTEIAGLEGARIELPRMSASGSLWLPVAEERNGAWSTALYASDGPGEGWRAIAAPAGLKRWPRSPDASTIEYLTGFDPDQVGDRMVLTESGAGLSYSRTGRCARDAGCAIEQRLFATEDGGEGWYEVTLPVD